MNVPEGVALHMYVTSMRILADIQGEMIENLDENKSVNKCADEPSSMLVDNGRGKVYDGAGSTQSSIIRGKICCGRIAGLDTRCKESMRTSHQARHSHKLASSPQQ